ncbi:MAG: hypothetical protein EOP57_00945, partial [Sphingomonadales bacterium]
LFFNTLGNFAVNPRAGLLFVDHETGDMLQIAGSVEIILNSPEIAAFEGAERLWRVMPEKVVLRRDALPLRWCFLEDGMSPSSLMTGDWREAASRLKVAGQAKTWRRFRVERTIEESSTIRSLHLAPVDDEAVIPHLAGQHLPISITDGADTIRRSYTLSSAPSDGFYRLSVKHEGRASALLHKMREGDEIEALSPAGAFTIDAMERARPAVLLAAGIGITPLLSMLRYVVHTGDRTRYRRQVWLFRSSRTSAERAFDREIGELVARSEGTVRDIKVLGAPDADGKGLFDAVGRIDTTLLKAQLPFGDYDFYICGPSSFMQSMYDGLRALNIADGRIHAEAFGPSGLKRDHPVDVSTKPRKPAASVPTPVVFTQSSKQAQWKPNAEFETTLDILATRLDVAYDEFGLDIYPDDASVAGHRPVIVPGSVKLDGDTVVAATINDVRFMASREYSLNRHDLLNIGLRQTWDSDAWHASGAVNWSSAHSYHPNYNEGTVRSRAMFFAPLTYDGSAGYKTIPTFTTPVDATNPANYQLYQFNIAPKDSKDWDFYT